MIVSKSKIFQAVFLALEISSRSPKDIFTEDSGCTLEEIPEEKKEMFAYILDRSVEELPDVCKISFEEYVDIQREKINKFKNISKFINKEIENDTYFKKGFKLLQLQTICKSVIATSIAKSFPI